MTNSIIIIAGGPSLTKADVKLAEKSGYPIMGINNAYQICEKLTYLYACDPKWWGKHHESGKGLPVKKYALESESKNWTPYSDIKYLKNAGESGVSFEWPYIYTGKNSGYQAINLAILLGYNLIILLGYDMQDTNGKTHWHGLHEGLNNPDAQQFEKWRSYYNQLASLLSDTSIGIINTTRETALECFPKMDLEAAIESVY